MTIALLSSYDAPQNLQWRRGKFGKLTAAISRRPSRRWKPPAVPATDEPLPDWQASASPSNSVPSLTVCLWEDVADELRRLVAPDHPGFCHESALTIGSPFRAGCPVGWPGPEQCRPDSSRIGPPLLTGKVRSRVRGWTYGKCRAISEDQDTGPSQA